MVLIWPLKERDQDFRFSDVGTHDELYKGNDIKWSVAFKGPRSVFNSQKREADLLKLLTSTQKANVYNEKFIKNRIYFKHN